MSTNTISLADPVKTITRKIGFTISTLCILGLVVAAISTFLHLLLVACV